MWSRTALTAGLALALAAPSAGAAPAPTKTHYVSAANAQCEATTVRLKRIAQLPKSPARVHQGTAEVHRLVSAIAQMRPPAGDEKPVAHLVASLETYAKALDVLAAAKTRDAFATAVQSLVSANKRAHAATLAYGLKTCAKLFGTP